jgi:serine/threonine-protein kinase
MVVAAEGWILDRRYRLERRVVSGSIGEVWQGFDVVLSRPVAVRLLDTDRGTDPAALARFKVEARRASAVTHENIAKVFDYNDAVAGQPPFLVTEFVDGRSLAEVLASGPLGVSATVGIVAQVAAGIAAAHEAGLTGLDVTPANVVLCAEGTVKVTDLGIGSLAGSERAGGPAGAAPAYSAPECVAGERRTPSADLYSLGVLADECLRGEPAFTGTPLELDAAHMVRVRPPLPGAIPAEVTALIMELTDKDPARRPASAALVAERASALREQVASPSPGPPAAAVAGPPTLQFPAALRPASGVPASQVPAPQAVADQSLARRPSPRRLLLVAVAAVAVAASALVLASHLDQTPRLAQNAVQAGRATAEVNGAAFKDVPVGVAGARLRRMGFLVRIRWRQSASVPAGLVIAVSPTGRLPLGSLVSVLGSRPGGESGWKTLGGPARNRHHQGRHVRQGGPHGKASHSQAASSPPSPSPAPTPTPSPTGTPSPAPSQSPTGSPAPVSSPSGTDNP